MKSLKKGFTLVELMVVIVIIGILAALAIPRFLGASAKAKATEFKPVMKQLTTLEEAFRQERETYTTNTVSLGWDGPSGGTARFSYSPNAVASNTFLLLATLNVDLTPTVLTNQTVSWLHNATTNADTKGGTAALVSLSNWN